MGRLDHDRRVDGRVLAAAENNARWCDLVCRSHGVPTAMRRGRWVALRRAPPLYPDAVTLRPGVVAEDVLRSVQDGPGCSVKDSFADLDLGPFGFGELFSAQWIFREPSVGRLSLPWALVETAEGLAEWAQAAGTPRMPHEDLLRDPAVRVLAARGPGGVRAGAIASRTASVVGVSNVFAADIAADEVWAGLTSTLAGLFPRLPLVGYEHGDGLRPALAGGFTAIGALRVWVRPG
jgi:hypothetical protein